LLPRLFALPAFAPVPLPSSFPGVCAFRPPPPRPCPSSTLLSTPSAPGRFALPALTPAPHFSSGPQPSAALPRGHCGPGVLSPTPLLAAPLPVRCSAFWFPLSPPPPLPCPFCPPRRSLSAWPRFFRRPACSTFCCLLSRYSALPPPQFTAPLPACCLPRCFPALCLASASCSISWCAFTVPPPPPAFWCVLRLPPVSRRHPPPAILDRRSVLRSPPPLSASSLGAAPHHRRTSSPLGTPSAPPPPSMHPAAVPARGHWPHSQLALCRRAFLSVFSHPRASPSPTLLKPAFRPQSASLPFPLLAPPAARRFLRTPSLHYSGVAPSAASSSYGAGSASRRPLFSPCRLLGGLLFLPWAFIGFLVPVFSRFTLSDPLRWPSDLPY